MSLAAPPTLRAYQTAAVEAVRREWSRGVKRTLLIMATGTGKTVVFSEIARRTVARGGRVLVVAHRTELLEQARDKLLAAGVSAAIEQGPKTAGHASVVVASVQTLRGKRLASWARDSFRVVIPDEAHHSVAAGYRAILETFSDAHVLGVTAAADRLDGKGLGEIYQSTAFRYELRDAIRDGWLVPLVAKRIRLDGLDLSRVHIRGGDLAADELGALMGEERHLHAVAAPLVAESRGRRTVVFAVNVTHARQLAAVLNRYEPGSAAAVAGEDPVHVRRNLLADFRENRLRFLVNAQLLTEGYDDPGIACVALTSPTQSRAMNVQRIGRGTRLHPGKTDLLVLDFTGSAGRLSLVGPEDVLAGRAIADDVRQIIAQRLEAGAEPLDSLLATVEAGIEATRLEASGLAIAKYAAEQFDPFVPAADVPRPPMGGWVGPLASRGHRSELEKLGLEQLPDALTEQQAVAWLAVLRRRSEMRLATLPQIRYLKRRRKIDARGMAEVEAGRLVRSSLNYTAAQRGAA